MKLLEKRVKAHLFVCCRKRDGKACCASKGSNEMVVYLKKWLKQENLEKYVKVSRSSCLNHCEEGVTACLYPQNKWYTRIDGDDLRHIKSLLREQAE